MLMRRKIVGVAASGVCVLLAACAVPSIIPDGGRIKSLRKLRVVALGPVPLELAPGMASAVAAQLPKPTISAARGVEVFSGILMLIEMPEALKRAAQAGRAVSDQLASQDSWSAQATVATDAAGQLQSTGRQVQGPVPKAMPGVSVDDYQNSLSPYYTALGNWWNSATSTVDYASPELEDVDALIEVGVSYSAFFFSELMLFLNIKVINPSTRAVIARDRDYAHKPIGMPDAVFREDAAQFKMVFGEMSTSLVRSTLSRIGFQAL
jgi:hypothetical protein